MLRAGFKPAILRNPRWWRSDVFAENLKGLHLKRRPVFVSAMETALHLCNWTDITLHAPYLHLTKVRG